MSLLSVQQQQFEHQQVICHSQLANSSWCIQFFRYISGDIDVDGTTNLDVLDIDGVVDMARH